VAISRNKTAEEIELLALISQLRDTFATIAFFETSTNSIENEVIE